MARRWHKRRYFVTQWEPGPPIDHLGPLKIDYSFSLPACTIYGFETDSEDERDHPHIDSAMKRGLIFGRWFSKMCIDGEWGNHRISELKDITREEFEKAEERRFTNLED